MRKSTLRISGIILAALVSAPAFADDPAPPPPPSADAPPTPPSPTAAPAPAAPAPFLKITGHVEGGITANPDSQAILPAPNYGHLFTDRSNQPLLNQVMLTVEHDTDATVKAPTLGFKVQGMYGSDSRYTHTLGLFDKATSSINQFDIVEAHIDAHLPVFASGGIDIKAGIYPTLEGAEVIDATGNFFYSHNYIFNFGIPFKHTGVMTTTHFSHGIDIYLGVDSGVNTGLGRGDDNGAAAFHGGVGFTVGKNITVLATTHIGPENSRYSGLPNYNRALRYLNDIVIVAKLTPKLTSTTDINYTKDNGVHRTAGGASEQLVYSITDQVSIGVRGEGWSDYGNFYVGQFPGNLDFTRAEFSLPNTSYPSVTSGVGTTYGELTFGVNWKPKLPAYTKNFAVMIRPEARLDHSFGRSKPFDIQDNGAGFFVGTKRNQSTVGVDAIVSF